MGTTAARTGILFTSVALAAVGAVTGAPQAAAAPGPDEVIKTSRGSVGWYHNGDEIVVCDNKKDGLAIEGHRRFAGDIGPGRYADAAGVGNCDAETWNTYEGAKLEIRMCYRDGVVITKCSDWQNAEA